MGNMDCNRAFPTVSLSIEAGGDFRSDVAVVSSGIPGRTVVVVNLGDLTVTLGGYDAEVSTVIGDLVDKLTVANTLVVSEMLGLPLDA